MRGVYSCSAAALLAALAPAALAADSDPANDVLAGAAFVDVTNPVLVEANLVGNGGDVDFFEVNLQAGTVLTAVVIPLDDPLLSPDTVLGILDSVGNVIAFNDDAGLGNGSAAAIEVLTSGTYYLAVSGTGDVNFDGSHSESGIYTLKLSVVVIPTPGGAALALAAGAFALRRRR